jgi:putative CocE/NonD family hydrolase
MKHRSILLADGMMFEAADTMGSVVRASDVMIPMRDGVRLATDLYRPAAEGRALPGPFPVLLERTPYDKRATMASERTAAEPTPLSREEIARFFARQGYVVALQDCRGRYRSEGVFTKYLNEAEDGYDTVVWLTRQPWSTGRVGTWGLSYSAHVQTAMAALSPPGLACMMVDSGGFSNAYNGGIRQGGAFELKQLTWAFNHARRSKAARSEPMIAAALEAEDIRAWFETMPWRRGHSPLRHVPEYEAYLLEQWANGAFSNYWKIPALYAAGAYDRFADVPMVHMAGWYDPYARTATENFAGLTARKRGPIQLILGPWTHGQRSVTYAGEVDFGPEATFDGQVAPDWLQFRLRWFDRWLKGIDNGADADARVRYFRMGGGSGRRNADGRLDHGGTWRSAAAWPPPQAVATPFFFHADGGLSTEPPPPGVEPLVYDHDPRHPVPTIGGPITSGAPIMEGGAFDQVEAPRFFGSRPPYLALAARRDVLVFQTPPLTEAVEITGPLIARLWVASNCPDTDFTAKLIDVHPATPDDPLGFAMNLTGGILRCRYRDSFESPALMKPGCAYAIEVELFPTSNLFLPGHRIRVDIASSNFPHFDVNPNTGAPEGQARHLRIATNSLFVDATRPSQILFPIMSGKS